MRKPIEIPLLNPAHTKKPDSPVFFWGSIIIISVITAVIISGFAGALL